MVEGQIPAVSTDIQDLIEQAIPGLRRVELAALLRASVAENVGTAIQILAGTGEHTVRNAPAAGNRLRQAARSAGRPRHRADPGLPGRTGPVHSALH
jgi:hypothetical protein